MAWTLSLNIFSKNPVVGMLMKTFCVKKPVWERERSASARWMTCSGERDVVLHESVTGIKCQVLLRSSTRVLEVKFEYSPWRFFASQNKVKRCV